MDDRQFLHRFRCFYCRLESLADDGRNRLSGIGLKTGRLPFLL